MSLMYGVSPQPAHAPENSNSGCKNWLFLTAVSYTHLELYGRTLGLIGFGAIGRRVGHTAKEGFGMKVKVYDPYCPAEVIEGCGCEKASLEETLSASDVVSIHLPVNDETRGIVDASWFAQMKSTAVFINTARAAVVDQRALIEALDAKRIAGAAMDVMWQEPAPENHRCV